MDWDENLFGRAAKSWKSIGDMCKKIIAERSNLPPLSVLTTEELEKQRLSRLANLRSITAIIDRLEENNDGDVSWSHDYKYKYAKSLKRAMEWDIMETMPRGKTCH